MLSSTPDDELLRRTGATPEAFAIFYRRHLPTVVAFLLRRTRDRELAADLTAEVFTAALESRTSFDSTRGDARAWLCTIAANKLRDSARRGRVEADARRRVGMPALRLDDDDLRRVDELAELAEVVPSASELLGDLPESIRAAVHARVIDEADYGEIATRLECSEAVVRQRVSRGLAALRLQLREDT